MGAGQEGFGDVTAGAILKYDRQTGARTSIELGHGRVPGESVFVPAENGKAEDDGYLMTYVYNAATDDSEFVIFDASTMSAEPVATVQLPRVPFGFHGSWVPAEVAN
jgi:carotenoid cleavage dioxygenase